MIDKNQIQLKYSSIARVPIQIYDQDFMFVVNGEEFVTSRLVSDLLSPKISNMHLSDPTIDRFTINIEEKGDFSHILQLVTFNKHNIQSDEFEFFGKIIEHLGNDNFEILESGDLCKITIDNVFSFIKKHEKFQKFFRKNYESEIEFISSHFYEISETHYEELTEVEYDTLIHIFNNNNFHIKDEDQLLKFINKIYLQNNESSFLYENVLFTNVSSESISEFLSIFDFNDMTSLLWSTLSKRLEKKILNKIENISGRYKTNIKTFLHQENKELNGIIRYLTEKVGKNIHDSGIITIATNTCHNDHHPKNLVDLDKNNCYWSGSTCVNAWIRFNFKNMRVKISSYSINTDDRIPGNCHIKNWAVEISDDGENWMLIDEHSNYDGLNGNNIIKTFDVRPNNFSQFVRIRQTGDYFGHPNVLLVIKSIEFYGQLKED